MTTNRLVGGNKSTIGRSVYRASEWAAMARAKGMNSNAEEWDKAAREGWDDDHYDSLKAAERHEKITKARKW